MTTPSPETPRRPPRSGNIVGVLELPSQTIVPVEEDLERFFTAWYGPPARPAESIGETFLPPALAGWHRQAARWDEPVTALNRMLPEHQTWYDGRVLVIYTEEQGTWLWGVIPEGDDPQVLERDNAPGASWAPTGEPLGDFLLHVALLEAVLGAPAMLGLDDATPEQLQALTDEMAKVQISPWRWPGPEHALWQRQGALGLSCVNRLPGSPVPADATWWVVLGARNSVDLSFAHGLGITFDTDTTH